MLNLICMGTNDKTFFTTLEVELEKGPLGLGMNIVGGVDSPHIANDTGIFITKIKPGTAAHNSKLNEGDRILSIDNLSLTDVTHDQAAEAFRKTSGRVKLIIEPGAIENISSSAGTSRSQSAMAISTAKLGGGDLRRVSDEKNANKSLPLSPSKLQPITSQSHIDNSEMRQRQIRNDQSRISLSITDENETTDASNRRSFIVRDLAYTIVGLATVATVSFFVYRRMSR